MKNQIFNFQIVWSGKELKILDRDLWLWHVIDKINQVTSDLSPLKLCCFIHITNFVISKWQTSIRDDNELCICLKSSSLTGGEEIQVEKIKSIFSISFRLKLQLIFELTVIDHQIMSQNF